MGHRKLEAEPGLETKPSHYISSPLLPSANPRSEEGVSSGQWWQQVVAKSFLPPPHSCALHGWESEPQALHMP